VDRERLVQRYFDAWNARDARAIGQNAEQLWTSFASVRKASTRFRGISTREKSRASWVSILSSSPSHRALSALAPASALQGRRLVNRVRSVSQRCTFGRRATPSAFETTADALRPR
jgi:hypothetical protein